MSDGTEQLLSDMMRLLMSTQKEVLERSQDAYTARRHATQMAQTIVEYFVHIFGDRAIEMIEGNDKIVERLESFCNWQYGDMDQWRKGARTEDI